MTFDSAREANYSETYSQSITTVLSRAPEPTWSQVSEVEEFLIYARRTLDQLGGEMSLKLRRSLRIQVERNFEDGFDEGPARPSRQSFARLVTFLGQPNFQKPSGSPTVAWSQDGCAIMAWHHHGGRVSIKFDGLADSVRWTVYDPTGPQLAMGVGTGATKDVVRHLAAYAIWDRLVA